MIVTVLETENDFPLSLGVTTTRTMMRVARKSDAPMVDYEDEAEFARLVSETCTQYQQLVSTVLNKQAASQTRRGAFGMKGVSLFQWTPAEAMSLGMADFHTLYEHGPVVLLRMTKKRGLAFVMRLNEQLVVAVTACCRTYFNTLNERFERIPYIIPHLPSLIDMYSLQHVRSLICQTVMDVIGFYAHCNCIQDLHAACFAYYTHPTTNNVTCRIPRSKVCEYLIAIASITHSRLGDRTPGLHLNADTIRLITNCIDFH